MAHKMSDAGFGRHVGGPDDRFVDKRGVGGRCNDAAPARGLHQAHGFAHGVEDPGQVYGDGAIPTSGIKRVDLAVLVAIAGRIPIARAGVDACVRKSNVESAKRGGMIGEDPSRRGAIDDIERRGANTYGRRRRKRAASRSPPSWSMSAIVTAAPASAIAST